MNPYEIIKAESLTSSFSDDTPNEVISGLRGYFGNARIVTSPDGSVLINTPQFGDDFPYRCTRYYEAEDLLLNTRRGIVSLVGVRRTGKTVIMYQLWNKVHTNHSYFITATNTISMNSLKSLVLDKDIDFLFIDEVTRLQDFISDIQDFLDFCFVRKTKVVLAGTASLLLYRTLRMQATGRSFIVNCTPFYFKDVYNIHGCSISFQDYCEEGLTLLERHDSTYDNIAMSVFESIDRGLALTTDIKANYTACYFFLVSNIIGMLDGIVRVPAITDNMFDINEFELLSKGTTIKPSMAKEFYGVFEDLGVIKFMPRRIISNDGAEIVEKKRLYYLSMFSLYEDFANRFARDERYNRFLNKNYGALFEAGAIVSILQALTKYRNFYAYSLRSEDGAFEIDMCIETWLESHDTITLVEFKRNSSKSGSHFKNESVINYCLRFEKVICYTVYEIGEPRECKVNIVDFISDIKRYIPDLYEKG